MSTAEKQGLFLQILEKHKGILYKVAHAYCADNEQRKDLVQEIVIQLWKSFNNYNDQYRYSTWIYRIALNVAISDYRKEHRRKEIAHPLSNNILELAENEMTDEKANQVKQLLEFINTLKDLDKALILLYLEEKPYKEIAAIMGISETNVGTKIGRIKIILQEKFSTL